MSEAGQVDGHPVHERPPLLEQGLEARVVEFDHSLDNRRTRELTGQDLAPQFAPAGHDLGAIIRRHFAEHFAGARNLALLAVRVGRRDQTVALQRIDRALHLVEFLFNVGRCCCACRIRCGAGFNFIVGKGIPVRRHGNVGVVGACNLIDRVLHGVLLKICSQNGRQWDGMKRGYRPT